MSWLDTTSGRSLDSNRSTEGVKDRVGSLVDLICRLGVELQKPELPLDDLRSRPHPGRLEGDVRKAEHVIPRGYFQEELGHARKWDISIYYRRLVRGIPRLHARHEAKRAKITHRSSPPGRCGR